VDHITEQLNKLSELSDEEVETLQESIESEFGSLEESAAGSFTVEVVDAMSELANALDSVRGEVSRREALAQELAARAAEAANRVHGTPETEEVPAEEEVPEEVPAEDEEDDEPVVASAETEETAAVEAEEAPADEAATEASAEEVVEPETVSETEASAEVEEPVTETETEASAEEAAEETTPAETEASAEEVAEVEAPVEAEASIEENTENEQTAQEEAQTVTASAEETFEAPADRRPVAQVTEAPVAIVAGADIPGVNAGSTLSNKHDVAEAFISRLHTIRRASGGDGEQHVVASFATQYSDDHYLFGTAEENGQKISQAVEETAALTASGGYGTPLPQRYDIFGFGTDARPVKDSLPKFQADRGGISYIEPPVLTDYADAVGVWTPDMDEAAADNGGSGADVLKNVLVVQGAQTRTADLDAITLQLQIGNLLSRAYPELVARHNELALIQHARLAEKTILAKIAAGSTAVTQASTLGIARDFLVTVRRAATQYRSRHRLPLETPLKAIIPNWLYEAIASDLALQMPGDDALGVGRQEINGYLSGSNVSFTPSYDLNEFGPQTAGALNSWEASGGAAGVIDFDWFLFSEGTWLFLDGGTLDIGVVRDSALVGTNDYRMFVESFEGVAKIGIESLRIRQTFKVSGEAAALTDTTP
jgi:chemotaxis protein histidine kinase CheA